jgi:hypothetical protein
MTRTRIALTTAGLIAAALAVIGLLMWLWDTSVEAAAFGIPVGPEFVPGLLWTALVTLLHFAAFGLGVYLSLRFLAPVEGESSWRRVLTRAIIATICGAVVAFAFSALVSLIAAVTIGAYPLGYSLGAAVDGNRIQFGIQNALAGAFAPLIQWLPATVLGVVLMKLWLGTHPAVAVPALPAPAKGRASVSG